MTDMRTTEQVEKDLMQVAAALSVAIVQTNEAAVTAIRARMDRLIDEWALCHTTTNTTEKRTA